MIAGQAFLVVDSLLLRLHEDLDHPWTLESMAAAAGYAPGHFSSLFSAFVGHPPMRYLRLLRLERAAFALETSPSSVTHVALDAQFSSPEAFTRAFRRAFGTAPSRVVAGGSDRGRPPELDPQPRLEDVGPFFAWGIEVDEFAPALIAEAFVTLAQAAPLDGPWQLGGIAFPWGWTLTPALRSQMCVRYLSSPAPPPHPIRSWRLPKVRALVWRYQGSVASMPAACRWIAETGVADAGHLREFLPLLSVIEQGGDDINAVVVAPVAK